jgi:putative tricarboxylic transport membrane protein
MLDSLGHFITAIGHFASPGILFHIAWATLLGIVIGMLPGLTATMGVALMTTLTYKMDADSAILILICMYIGAIYGGSRSAILLNIPGTPANAATSLDGFPLAKQGLAGKAMGIATTGSFLGSVIGMVFLALFAPVLAEYALDFGAFEFFWLAVFGIVISGNLTAFDDPLKGWIAGFLGLSLAMVGQEGIHAYGRFTFGSTELLSGFDLIPALVGAFGFAEILTVMHQTRGEVVKSALDSVIPKLSELARYWRTVIRSGIIGTFIGIIPGVGEDIGAWVSYAAARRASKERAKFGKGSVEGLMAAETGNNAAAPGALIPVLTLAIPGSAPAAVLLAAMTLHGVQPGPMITIESPGFIPEVVAMVLMASAAMLIFGLAITKPLIAVLAIPRERLMPCVFVLCVIGPYAITNRLFDIWVMLGFGILGFVLRRMSYPMAPLVLGIVLGPILDKSFRRGLTLTGGDLEPFFLRPISAVLCAVTVLTILLSLRRVRVWLGLVGQKVTPPRLRRNKTGPEKPGAA